MIDKEREEAALEFQMAQFLRRFGSFYPSDSTICRLCQNCFANHYGYECPGQKWDDDFKEDAQ